MDLSQWEFSKITDYFDNRKLNSILEYSQKIRSYSETEKQKIYKTISDHVLKLIAFMRANTTKELFLGQHRTEKDAVNSTIW